MVGAPRWRFGVRTLHANPSGESQLGQAARGVAASGVGSSDPASGSDRLAGLGD